MDAVTKQLQEQALAVMRQSQEATVRAISLWGAAVDRVAARLPAGLEVPRWPLADSLPTPAELSDQFFDFARQVLDQQQEFVQQVLAALPGQDHRATGGCGPS